MIRVVNRVLLALIGLALLCAGGGVLARGLGWAVPAWWPYNSPHDVLLSDANRARYRSDPWFWPIVIGGLAVLVVLAVWWLLAQLRRARLAEVLVDSGDGQGALLRGRAMESVLADEAESLDGVARANVRLTGRRSAPSARIRLLLEPHASPSESLNRLATETLTRAKESSGLSSFPAEVRLRAARHTPERVT
ncbi:alkaline shock response membrane anchor protein AmaP [Streptomyces sp. GMY02]|uniref:alkaline shock response membrane anchor protein AmaP n=1 Tax=Streptomyces sp. GMY02 TaxID=1333528 RepID=UPI001C2C58F5|nr:alkaline shock response membrane anchor protein AmaP [Streptomyces sp. GMY02]QXE37522.1 alkaline shock response membrane anchor protein AmaP [Streptomyces sp. GMY02]